MATDQQDSFINKTKLFVGLVDSSDASTYVLTVAPIEHDSTTLSKVEGVAVHTCFANVFGFKDCTVIQPGSRVLCYLLQPRFCLVLSILPNNDIDVLDYPSRANLGAGDAIVDSSNLQGYLTDLNKSVLSNNRRPSDIVDGEHVIQNDYGVALKLMSFMAGLYASPTSQVQCSLLDDMVRIISHNWEHHTAMGTFRVTHDGQSLNAEFEATASPAEAQGVPEVNTPATTSLMATNGTAIKDDSKDWVEFTSNERAQHIARFKIFLGKLGDFFNMFLSRPATNDAPRDLQGTVPETYDTGLFQHRLAMDGGFYIRSVKEIFLEKTNWIRVPQRIKMPEDPSGDNGNTIQFDPKVPYQWDTSQQANDNPYLMFLQLRNYVAYVNEVLAYQNFNKQTEDFAVSQNLEDETLLSDIVNIDPNTPATLQNYALRTSGIYLMENGGITLKDAWGSAIIMEGGNVYIQPANDLVMQPLRHMVAKVGGYTSIAGQEDIDLSSTSGAFRVKADDAIYLYSDSSGVVLEANGTTQSPAVPDPITGALATIDGIVLKSNLGIFNFAQQTIANVAQQSFMVKATKDVRLDAQGTAQVSATGTAILYGSSSSVVISDSETMVLSDGFALFAGAGSTVLGQKNQSLGVTFPPNSLAVDIQGVVDVLTYSSPLEKAALKDSNLLDLASPFNTTSSVSAIQFKFPASVAYTTDFGSMPAPLIPMTMAQQEDLTSGLYGLTPWTENAVNSTFPFPGADGFDNSYAATSGNIPNLQPYEGKDYTGLPTATGAKWGITLTTLQNYKTQ